MAASQLSRNGRRELKWRVRGVPVFGYHGVASGAEVERPARERKYWVREGEFRRQLERIRRNGYAVGRLENLAADTSSSRRMVDSVVLTFDDGLVSQYTLAFPLLAEFRMRAYFFVNTSTIGQAGFLSWDQMLEMQRAGMSFQSHSHEHVYLSWLSTLERERQLRDSRRILEDRLGSPVHFLSAPFGDLNRQVVETAKRLGYEAVCNSRNWPAHPGSYLVNRVAVYSATTAESFERLLTGDPLSYAARLAREAAVYAPKRLLLRRRPSPAPAGSLSRVAGK